MAHKENTRKFKRKIGIIDIIIQKRVVTTDDLIEILNLKPNMKNPRAALTKPIRELRRERIIPAEIELVPQRNGRPPQYIRIIQSRDTIQFILDNYPMCAASLYNSGWVQDLIINMRITCPLSKVLKNQLKLYLRSSPSFFEYLLTDNKIEEKAHEWFWHVYAGIVDHAVITEHYRQGEAIIPKKLFHEFFYLCAFIDMLNGEITPEARRFIRIYNRIIKNKSSRD